MLDEVASIEKVEAELNAFIDRRARGNAAENEREELWRASVRRHHDRLRKERLLDRLAYHEEQLVRHTKTFEALLKKHRVGIRLVEEALGLSITEETKGDAA